MEILWGWYPQYRSYALSLQNGLAKNKKDG